MTAAVQHPRGSRGGLGSTARRLGSGLVALSLVLACAAAEAAQRPIGEVRSILAVAYGTQPGGERHELQLFEPVVSHQRVETEPNGSLHISFHDDTDLWLEGGSDLVLDEVVYNPKTGFGRFSVDLGAGIFRVVTGSMPHKSYAIRTPVATIGVRGTDFGVMVAANGATRVTVYSGSVELTPRDGGPTQIVEASESASVGDMPPVEPASPEAPAASPTTSLTVPDDLEDDSLSSITLDSDRKRTKH